MPHFRHRVTGVTREWRTDNEDIFRRLHNKGWRRVEEEAPATPEPEQASLSSVFPDSVYELLQGAGYETVSEVKGASDEALEAIDGIGPATLRKIRETLE